MKIALKLLFQFRVMVGKSAGVQRKCEERYIVIDNVHDISSTLDSVYSYAKKSERVYKNTDGNTVYHEFVGVIDYILMENECDDIEFWYDYTTRRLPMENKKAITMSKSTIKKKIKQYFLNKTKRFKEDKEANSHMNINMDMFYE